MIPTGHNTWNSSVGLTAEEQGCKPVGWGRDGGLRGWSGPRRPVISKGRWKQLVIFMYLGKLNFEKTKPSPTLSPWDTDLTRTLRPMRWASVEPGRVQHPHHSGTSVRGQRAFSICFHLPQLLPLLHQRPESTVPKSVGWQFPTSGWHKPLLPWSQKPGNHKHGGLLASRSQSFSSWSQPKRVRQLCLWEWGQNLRVAHLWDTYFNNAVCKWTRTRSQGHVAHMYKSGYIV